MQYVPKGSNFNAQTIIVYAFVQQIKRNVFKHLVPVDADPAQA